MMRKVLMTVVCRFGSWSLVMKLNFVQTLSTRFGQDFEAEVKARIEAGVWSLFSVILILYVSRSEIILSVAHSSPCFSLPVPVSGDRLIEAACHCSLDKKVSLNSKSIRRTLPRYMTRTSWMTWNVFVQDVECICQYLSAVLRIYCIWVVRDKSQPNTHFRDFVCINNCPDLLLNITKWNVSNF